MRGLLAAGLHRRPLVLYVILAAGRCALNELGLDKYAT